MCLISVSLLRNMEIFQSSYIFLNQKTCFMAQDLMISYKLINTEMKILRGKMDGGGRAGGIFLEVKCVCVCVCSEIGGWGPELFQTCGIFQLSFYFSDS